MTGRESLRAPLPRTHKVAALYVERDGVYFGLPDVDPWDEERDARLYPGPHPVVAHPPCARWSSLAYVNQAMHGYRVGDDGGCFAAALEAVRTYGGVLEHPANSIAWKTFGLPRPSRDGWTQSMSDPGWSTEVSQVTYGHRARKRTWVYYVGEKPPAELDWRDSEGECIVGDLWHGNERRLGRGDRPRMYQREALATPAAFRDVLLRLARDAQTIEVTTPHVTPPYSPPSEPVEWIYTAAGRVECASCGEWIYTRRHVSGGPSAFPDECQVCGAPTPKDAE